MNKRQIGTGYEEKAQGFLIQKGHILLQRNYRIRSGEIDLITKDGNYLVFTEVKFRRDNRAGTGAEAVGRRKQETIVRTALHYLLVHGYPENTPCRFDVISISNQEILHFENAFEV